MAIKTFTEEEIILLKQNPYVKQVSRTTITYTQEFREYFVSEYEKGTPPSVILRQSGFDRSILGKERCESMGKNFRRIAPRAEGLQDLRKGNSGRQSTKEITSEEEIQRLKHKSKYLEQENEYLKKIEDIDKKAASRARRQKKNSELLKK